MHDYSGHCKVVAGAWSPGELAPPAGGPGGGLTMIAWALEAQLTQANIDMKVLAERWRLGQWKGQPGQQLGQ